jgi:uncharacterized protein (UPF0333 family)
MKNLSKGFGLVVLLGVLAIVISGSYYVASKYLPTKPAASTADNSAIDQARQAVSQLEQRNQDMMEDRVGADTMAGWKTYTNTKYGFEFKYPADHTAYSSVENDQLISASTTADEVQVAEKEALARCCDPLSVGVSVDKVSDSELRDPELVSTSFGGRSALVLNGTGGLDSAYKTIYVKTASNHWLTIRQESQSVFLDSVLSTFRFTN